MSFPGPAGPYVGTSAEYRPDRFYRYAELTAIIKGWVDGHPDLAELSSIGKSHEGRDLWCVTVTNRATGPAHEKPAYFIDGNIHAGEVTGSAVALYTLRELLTGYGTDERVTRLLDESAFYVVPRVSPDGAEKYLTDPGTPRSSVRTRDDRDPVPGLNREDVDGDGWITTMRIPDPHGPWKASEQDPRVMVPRKPDEVGGRYYWVLPEGTLTDHEGLVGNLQVAPRPWWLDLNRNFPLAWEPEALTEGSGPYPLSEPETRALGEFLISHPNISGSQHYHTFSGVILRPSSRCADADLPARDLAQYKAIGAIGEEETTYKCISLFHDFTTNPRKLYSGMLVDWAYDHLGVMTFSTELWNLGKLIGLERADKPLDFYFGTTRTEDDEIAMLKWVDDTLDGFGFVPWKPFDHPQLGRVEIGGWQIKYVFQNAPGPVLEEVCRRNCAFTLRAAACGPRLTVAETAVTKLGDGVYRVEAVLQNAGYLPTQGTERAVAMKVLKADRASLASVEVVSGPAEQKLEFLAGRGAYDRPPSLFPEDGLPTRRKVWWTVRGQGGDRCELTAWSQRGGVARVSLELPAEGVAN